MIIFGPLAGMILGPWAGAIAGLIGGLIGMFISPGSYPLGFIDVQSGGRGALEKANVELGDGKRTNTAIGAAGSTRDLAQERGIGPLKPIVRFTGE